MPRTARAAVGGLVYHVLNRGNGRMGVFRKPGDYQAFVDLLALGKERARVEVFGFCLMPNHWHVVLRPQRDRDLAAYLSWVTNTHVKRYRAHYPRTSGHLYQGRYGVLCGRAYMGSISATGLRHAGRQAITAPAI